MDKVFLLLLPFYLFANSYSGVWLDLKSGKQVKIEDYDREVYTFYGKDLLEGKNGNIYRKLDISNNLFFGNVY
ncbi:MAG: hypothetical protein OIF32_07670, partial [Campylobacterales bacterium]|nr:hypothetical protein [Campylobacterales bacterium]